MARLFNLEVINATLVGGTSSPVYSSPELQNTLGTMEVFHLELTVEAVTVNGTDVEVIYEVSNDGQNWFAVSSSAHSVSITTAGTGPDRSFLNVSDFVNGAYGRFKATADQGVVPIRVVVCGRSR